MPTFTVGARSHVLVNMAVISYTPNVSQQDIGSYKAHTIITQRLSCCSFLAVPCFHLRSILGGLGYS